MRCGIQRRKSISFKKGNKIIELSFANNPIIRIIGQIRHKRITNILINRAHIHFKEGKQFKKYKYLTNDFEHWKLFIK